MMCTVTLAGSAFAGRHEYLPPSCALTAEMRSVLLGRDAECGEDVSTEMPPRGDV